MSSRSPINQKEKGALDWVENFVKNQEPLEPEFEKVFWENYWDLLA